METRRRMTSNSTSQSFFHLCPILCAVLNSNVHKRALFAVLNFQVYCLAVLVVLAVRPGYICENYFTKLCTLHLVI